MSDFIILMTVGLLCIPYLSSSTIFIIFVLLHYLVTIYFMTGGGLLEKIVDFLHTIMDRLHH
jgi:hypothetical protein